MATEWVEVPTETMLTARKRKRLSYEAMGRALNVSSKTYERYEKQGRVPVDQLDRVAEVLALEIERPADLRVVVPPPSINGHGEERWQREMRDEIKRGFAALDRRLGSIESALRASASSRVPR